MMDTTDEMPRWATFNGVSMVVAVNVGEHVVALADALPGFGPGELVLSSAVEHDDPRHLPGNTACWISIAPTV